ncbi:penicillin acylase family protein [Vibrio fluvialis]|nr:penicillin acylase family protein [Vibrio fluvialis]ELU8399616.1 penicillin acylase family protein [Vibrio fluvialis]
MNQHEWDQVNIRWTDHDVPHIEAQNYVSLGFGYGYVHARDRLCELSGQVITLRGERSKHYGAERFSTIGFLKTTNLNSDLMFRLRLPPEWVENELAKLSTQTREYVQGYVRGLNHYVDQMPAEEKQRWRADEPLVTFTEQDVVRAAMRFGIMKELVEIGPHLVSSAQQWHSESAPGTVDSPHATPVEVEGGFGSNAWAFGGDVVAGERAILLGNPHSAWKRTPHQQRIYMHQYHLTIPGELDVAGTSFLGFPLPMTGYNADVAWSILDAASVTPFVLQKMAIHTSGNTLSYRVDGENRPLSIRAVAVEVLEASGEIATRHYEFLESELGVLYHLPHRAGKPQGWYAITNPGEQNARGLDQFMAAAKTTSTRDFVAAIESQRGILCQLVVADRHGEVAYVVAGNVPPLNDDAMAQRHVGDAESAFNVLDGTRSDAFLRGSDGQPLLAPASFYPTVISRGIIQNTNNSYKFSEYGAVQPDFPSVFGQHKAAYQVGKHIAAGLRYDPRLIMSTRRLDELTAEGPITPDKVLPIIFDNRNYAAETFLDQILSVGIVSASAAVCQACEVLSRWDRKNNATSQGALLFHLFWNRIVQLNVLNVPSSGDPTLGSQLDTCEANEPVISQALAAAVDELNALGFALDTAWGEALFETADNTKIALHGGSYQEGLLNGEMPAPLDKNGFPHILFGSAYVQLATWDEQGITVQGILSHGQRDGVESLGRTTQLQQFANKQLHDIPFTEAQLDAATFTETASLRMS